VDPGRCAYGLGESSPLTPDTAAVDAFQPSGYQRSLNVKPVKRKVPGAPLVETISTP
jgi:hypothetical protein